MLEDEVIDVEQALEDGVFVVDAVKAKRRKIYVSVVFFFSRSK